MTVILSFFRTAILYLALIAVVRLMGKRQVGELEPAEFVVAMLLADLAAIPMQDGALPLLTGLIPIGTVLGLELTLSGLSLRSIRLRQLLCGRPVILIDNGHLLQDNLRRTRVTLDELMGQLREKNILTLQDVQFAILETNGCLSVFPYPDGTPPRRQALPLTLISDGHLLRHNLALAKKDGVWLRRVLQERNLTVEDTYLLTVDENGGLYCIQKEEPN